MPALRAIFSGDSNNLKKEFDKVNEMAARAGKNIERSLSGGSGGHGGAKSGVMREFLVLTREISRGNWSRVPGSLSILLQQMNVLKFLFKDTSTAADILAAAYQKQATAAGVAAIASARKAAAAQADLYATGGETEENLAAAVSAEQKAVADYAVARATEAKAIASEQAAAASRAEGAAATLALGPIGWTVAAVVALAATVYSLSKYVQQTADDLASLKPPDVTLEYIAKTKQAINAAAEAQKEINREVEKTVELYDSAAQAATRMEEATKAHFEHEKKMADLLEQTALKTAKTPEERAAVRAGFAAQRIATSDRERSERISNKETEQNNLTAESARKKREGDAIKVPSKEREQQNVNAKRNLVLDYEHQVSDFSSTRQATPENLAALKNKQDQLKDARSDYKRSVDQSSDNDELRKRKSELYKGSADSAGKAAVVGREIKDMRVTQQTERRNQVEEEGAKLLSEDAGDKPEKKKIGRGHLTEYQQQGAFSGPVGNMQSPEKANEKHLVQIAKSLLSIDKKIKGKSEGGGGKSPGEVMF